MTESALVDKIRAALQKRGCFVLKLHGGPLQRAGIPDLLVLHRGRAVFLEVKRPGEDATKLQVHTIGKIRAAGITAAVVDSLEAALVIIGLCDS